MKRILVSLLIITLILSNVVSGSYAYNGTYIGGFDPEIQREAQERNVSYNDILKEQRLERISNNAIIGKAETEIGINNVSNDGRYVSSPIKLIKQTTDYNCGATAALQVLYGCNCQGKVSGKNDSKKISTLMNDAETNAEEGTVVYKLKNALNKYSALKYKYTSASKMDKSKLREFINNSLFYNTAPIIHAKTEKIEYYKKHVSGHYIAIQQLDLTTNKIRVYDCNNDTRYYGSHDITLDDAYASLTGSRYLIHLNK